jgi:hypothetical protein
MELLVAVPAAFSATGEPKFTPSTTNCAEPIGVTPVPEAFVTVAVNVTPWPNTDGFTEEVTPVAVVALFTIWPPLNDPLLLLKFPSELV